MVLVSGMEMMDNTRAMEVRALLCCVIFESLLEYYNTAELATCEGRC